MLRSFRHTVVLSALILTIVAPTAFASPVQSYDLDFGVRASIEALFARLGDLLDDVYASGPATAEPAMEATFEASGPGIPVNGDTDQDDGQSSSAETGTPTHESSPGIPVNGIQAGIQVNG